MVYIRCIWQGNHLARVGQNHMYAPYITVYLLSSLPKLPYIHHTYIRVSSQPNVWHVTGRNSCGACNRKAQVRLISTQSQIGDVVLSRLNISASVLAVTGHKKSVMVFASCDQGSQWSRRRRSLLLGSQTYTCTCTHTNMHTNTHTHKHNKHTQHTCACTHTYNTHACAHIYTYTHIYTHTTHTHTHTHANRFWQPAWSWADHGYRHQRPHAGWHPVVYTYE